MKTKIISFIIIVIVSLSLVGCGAMPSSPDFYPPSYESDAGDEFTEFTENQFIDTASNPISYFSMDVSTASYPIIRNYINNGISINKNSVKIEEMLNYFRYSYPSPENGKPMSISGNVFPCAWNSESLLCSVGIRAKDIEFQSIRNNIVFLIDVSGSMDSPNKLGLLQEAFSVLADNLNDNDIVSIVTYAGNSATILEGESGSSRMRIKNIISDLVAGGSTAGEGGIKRAYALAERYYIEDGNNRVILATDGDFNVGISSQNELKDFINEKRSQSKGIYLSIMGFGLGNLKSNTMDTLAQNGNGSAYYIDSSLEAKKVMADEMMGTLVTVADDVKAAVEFNPDLVASYRLLGYETKLLTQDDWQNDRADAGEIGAGHTVTAVYEIKLNENSSSNDLLEAKVRYKEPYSGERPTEDNREVQEISCILQKNDILNNEQFLANEDLVFISCVIEFALIIMQSDYKAEADITNIIQRLENLGSVNTNEYRADFLELVKRY